MKSERLKLKDGAYVGWAARYENITGQYIVMAKSKTVLMEILMDGISPQSIDAKMFGRVKLSKAK